jgi:hypothetical protein
MIEMPEIKLAERAVALFEERRVLQQQSIRGLCRFLRINTSAYYHLAAGSYPHRRAFKAVAIIRTLRGLPPGLTREEEREAVEAIIESDKKRPGWLAKQLGCTRQLTSYARRKGRVSIGLWAMIFPERIGCSDIIASPLASDHGRDQETNGKD